MFLILHIKKLLNSVLELNAYTISDVYQPKIIIPKQEPTRERDLLNDKVWHYDSFYKL